MENDERFPLDDIAISIIADLREQMKPQQMAVNAVLFYFARTHGISGAFGLAENGRELVLKARQEVK